MSIPPAKAGAPFEALSNNVRHVVEDAQRTMAYDRADMAAKIGLEFDEIKLLVDQLLRDLDTIPSPQAVADVSGASSYAAEAFARPLHETVTAAYVSTRAIRDQVSKVSDAVLQTITELSSSDADAKKVLAPEAAELQQTIASTTSLTLQSAPVAGVIAAPAPAAGEDQGGGTSWR